MVDTKTPGDKTLSVPTKTLTLKPRVETGTVRQSFSHGRTKSVVVETKRKRVVVPTAAPKPGTPGTGQTATPTNYGDPSKRPAGISDAEMDRRMTALRAAKATEISPDATPAEKNRAKRDIDRFTKQIAEVTEWERDILYPLAVERIRIDLDDGGKRHYPLFPGVLKPIKGLEADDDA